MLTQNPLKKKLSGSDVLLGTWNTLASPLVTEILARAGLDFVVIDMEHGPYQLDQVHKYVDKCEAFDCSPLVRIPTNADWMALQALDQGAHGVIVPHIDTADQARALVKATKYHPLGERGFTPFSKAGGFTNKGAENYSSVANDNTVVGVIIESKEGLKNLDEILKVDGIDVVYFGAYDLSQALGHPGQVKSDAIAGEISAAAAKVNAAGKVAGGYVPQSLEEIKWAKDMGLRFLTYQVDCSVILENYASICQQVRSGEI